MLTEPNFLVLDEPTTHLDRGRCAYPTYNDGAWQRLQKTAEKKHCPSMKMQPLRAHMDLLKKSVLEKIRPVDIGRFVGYLSHLSGGCFQIKNRVFLKTCFTN